MRMASAGSFRHRCAGAAELGRKIFQLGQAVLHTKHGLRVVDVNAGRERESGDGRSEYIDKTQRRMIGQQVSATFRAKTPLAEFGLLKCRDMLGAGGDPYGLRFPEAESVHRPAGPRTAGTAMAVAHGLRRSGNLQLDRPAKTTS